MFDAATVPNAQVVHSFLSSCESLGEMTSEVKHISSVCRLYVQFYLFSELVGRSQYVV